MIDSSNSSITITKNSIKSLQLYVILLGGFSLLFHLFVFDSDSRDDFDFADIVKEFDRSVIRTIVMSTGEFDFSDLSFQYHSQWIFVAFVFLITTIFMNLMNGLAVDDIRKIQSNAELDNIKKTLQNARLLRTGINE